MRTNRLANGVRLESGVRITRIARALLHPITEARVTWAKRIHRRANPHCAVCHRIDPLGYPCEVHHREPVHARPELATHPANLVTLCRLHHFIVGHCGDWRHWNAALDRTISALLVAYVTAAVDAEVATDSTISPPRPEPTPGLRPTGYKPQGGAAPSAPPEPLAVRRNAQIGSREYTVDAGTPAGGVAIRREEKPRNPRVTDRTTANTDAEPSLATIHHENKGEQGA